MLILTGILAMALLTMPFWMGSALHIIAPKEIIQFQSYERLGYGRFKLTGIEVDSPQASLTIDSLEALTPLNWIRNTWKTEEARDFVQLGTVTIDLKENQGASGESSSDKLPQNLPDALVFLEKNLQTTDKWLPQARVDKIILNKGEDTLSLNTLSWKNRQLRLSGSKNKFSEYPFELFLDLATNSQNLDLKIPAAEFDSTSQLKWTNELPVVGSVLNYRENSAYLELRFNREAWIPQSADWNLADWHLDIEEYSTNTLYSELQFNLEGSWDTGSMNNLLAGQLTAEPDSDQRQVPAVTFESAILGNPGSVSVEQFSLTSPGIDARISEPINYNLQTLQLEGDIRFDIDLDLGLFNREDLQGKLEGLLEVSTENDLPVGIFNLSGTGVQIKTHSFESMEIQADLNWPILQLHELSAQLDSGSIINGQGSINLDSREVNEASIHSDLKVETLKSFLPEGISLSEVSFSGELSGPFDSLEHNGTLLAQAFETTALKPVSLTASWEGNSLLIDFFETTVTGESSSLLLSGSGEISSSDMTWKISDLVLKSESALIASLQSEATLEYLADTSTKILLRDINLTGPVGEISLQAEIDFPQYATIDFKAGGIDTELWLNSWLKDPPPPLQINSAISQIKWNEGPVQFESAFDICTSVKDQPIQASGEISSTGRRIQIVDMIVTDQQSPWITANGDLPISISLEQGIKFKIDKDAALSMDLETSESANWLDLLSTYSPFEIDQFFSKARLRGSLSDLEGSFDFQLITEEGQGDHAMPPTTIAATGGIDHTQLTLSSATVSVNEEAFNLSGGIKLPEELVDLIEDSEIEIPWQETVLSLVIPKSEITPIRYFAPGLLSEGGEIEAELSGSIASGIEGFFRVQGLTTRSIFPFGSMRNLTADIQFDGQSARLNDVSGYIGREPITIAGELDYRDWKQPSYQFTLVGNDLPILRKPGLLLRSDINLSIDKANKDPTSITGEVTMKDGLFLLNKNSIPSVSSGGGKSASTRPPYFAVEVAPLSEWEMDIAVKGDQFMSVKTPAADGILSLDMQLQGKLKEPFAIGRVEFENGNLFFPFASFEIEQGLIEIPIDNPYTPMLEIIGSSQRFGYDLGIEIRGSAYDPQIRFTSSPPLTSEQIMLMVVAGENPDGMFKYSASQRASKLGLFISKGLFAGDESNGGLMSRFSLDTGENLSEQGKETMEIEFRLDDRFQLIGEYDEYDFWNAGLRWRIYRRHVIESEQKGNDP